VRAHWPVQVGFGAGSVGGKHAPNRSGGLGDIRWEVPAPGRAEAPVGAQGFRAPTLRVEFFFRQAFLNLTEQHAGLNRQRKALTFFIPAHPQRAAAAAQVNEQPARRDRPAGDAGACALNGDGLAVFPAEL